MAKSLILCADDYAMSAAIDDAILALIGLGRVSAAGCMTGSARWPSAARALVDAARGRCDIGLHLDFTQFLPPSAYTLASLIMRAQLRLLNRAAIKHAINAQLTRFEDAVGSRPDYVDGHQHVHQLPVIRDVLLDVLCERYADARPWLRASVVAEGGSLKGLALNRLGGKALQRASAARGLRTTTQLLGVYSFRNAAGAYRARLESWLSRVEGASALMCHPGARLDASDPIAAARHMEFEVFSGETFRAALERHDLKLERGTRVFARQAESAVVAATR